MRMLKDTIKEIIFSNEGSWGDPWGSPMRVKIVEKAKIAKIHFFKENQEMEVVMTRKWQVMI